MKNRSRPFVSLLRVVALGVFAALLLVRLGPFCEASAMAAPIASAMAGCEGKGTGTPEKKSPVSTCTSPCAAVRGDALTRVETAALSSIAPNPAPVSGLVGLPVPPATPPPRSV